MKTNTDAITTDSNDRAITEDGQAIPPVNDLFNRALASFAETLFDEIGEAAEWYVGQPEWESGSDDPWCIGDSIMFIMMAYDDSVAFVEDVCNGDPAEAASMMVYCADHMAKLSAAYKAHIEQAA